MRFDKIVVAAATATIVSLAVGAGVAWSLARRANDREILGCGLVHELELTGLCANSLKLTTMQWPDKVTLLLEQRLDSALRAIAQYMDDGADLRGFSVPELRDSLRRAADYYAARGELERKQIAETLLARLNASR